MEHNFAIQLVHALFWVVKRVFTFSIKPVFVLTKCRLSTFSNEKANYLICKVEY